MIILWDTHFSNNYQKITSWYTVTVSSVGCSNWWKILWWRELKCKNIVRKIALAGFGTLYQILDSFLWADFLKWFKLSLFEQVLWWTPFWRLQSASLININFGTDSSLHLPFWPLFSSEELIGFIILVKTKLKFLIWYRYIHFDCTLFTKQNFSMIKLLFLICWE